MKAYSGSAFDVMFNKLNQQRIIREFDSHLVTLTADHMVQLS